VKADLLHKAEAYRFGSR